MKKILIFLILLIFQPFAFATFAPKSTKAVNHWGIGVLRIANEITIYEQRNEKSPVVQKIYWDNLGNYKTAQKISQQNTFLAFVPEKNFAFLTVEDEDDAWVQICYNQKNLKYGWIKKDSNSKFLSWKDFILKYGKKYGLAPFEDAYKGNKKLYAKPSEASQIVDSWDFSKFILPWYVNGNWLMVKLYDYDDAQKTGYMKWRDETGNIFVFPKLK